MMKPIESRSSFYDDVLSSTLANNTRITYNKGWSCFQDYCAVTGVSPLSATPDQMADYFIDLGSRANLSNGKKLSISTLVVYRSAINRRYVEAQKPSPANHPKVNAILKGLARLRGARPRRVQALREHHILGMLDQCGNSLIGLRDAAVIALGFSAALRRSEICALTIDDIQIIPPLNGEDTRKMFVHVRKSKTDQAGKGQRIAIPEGQQIRPIKRLEDWLRAAGIKQGYVFQTMWRGARFARPALASFGYCPAGEALRRGYRPESRRHRRPLATGRLCHQRGRSPCPAGQDHGNYPPQQPGDGDEIHPGRGVVQRPRRQGFFVTGSDQHNPLIMQDKGTIKRLF